jgi:prefoldin, archaeal alpha subunit/eukaryotic subunit 5
MENPNAENQREFEAILEAMERYREELPQLNAQLNLVTTSLSEHLIARETIKNYEKVEEGTEVLVPIGGNVHIKSVASHDRKVIIGIGAGYTMEKSVEKCVEMLNKRIEELEKGRERMSNNIKAMESKMRELSNRAETLARGMQGVFG